MSNKYNYTQVVVASDTHLKPLIWANRPEIVNDSYWAFKSIIDYCAKNNCPLILAGDILDNNRPTSETMLFLQGELSKLIELGLDVFWIKGNHDDADPAWGLMIEGVQTLNERCANLLPDTCFYGLDYRPARELQEILPSTPIETRVLVCHQLLDAAFPMEGIHNMKMEWVPGHIKMVMLGDYHVCVEYKDSRNLRFVYNGSTCLQSLSESPNKYFTSITLDGEGNPTYTRIPCTVRAFHNFDIRSNKDLEQVLQTVITNKDKLENTSLPEELRTPIIRIKYSPSVADVAQRLHEVIGKDAHLWIIPHPLSIDRNEEANTSKGESFSPANALKSLVNKEVSPELYNFCLELITDDYKSVIPKYRDKYCKA